MKKLIILLTFVLLATPVLSKTIEGGIDFDWISKTQLQRDENIAQIKKIILSDSTVIKYPKKVFRDNNAKYLKDPNYLKNYAEISNGKKYDENCLYSGFFWKNNLLIAYGIQHKDNMKNIYYYDAIGRLQWVDNFSENYPDFPYISYQYRVSGKLIAMYYYVSDFDQYVFNPNKKFIGRWYKEKLYNNKAKVIMTRSNY